MPVLPLDRIYYRGLKLKSAHILKGRPWNLLSDHLPVLGHFSMGVQTEKEEDE
jgi:endonuclease/exonuclease/phosphatase (EEP) superfamily protein YafD